MKAAGDEIAHLMGKKRARDLLGQALAAGRRPSTAAHLAKLAYNPSFAGAGMPGTQYGMGYMYPGMNPMMMGGMGGYGMMGMQPGRPKWKLTTASTHHGEAGACNRRSSAPMCEGCQKETRRTPATTPVPRGNRPTRPRNTPWPEAGRAHTGQVVNPTAWPEMTEFCETTPQAARLGPSFSSRGLEAGQDVQVGKRGTGCHGPAVASPPSGFKRPL
jgi:hypothetical protein